MAATMKDIARRTGLGLATISSYFNGGNVREKNRGKNNKCKRGNRNAGKGEIRKEDSRIREGAKGKRQGNKQN